MSAGEHWDYIVVGAGAAGCVLANRLTASGVHRVLVLEAGGSDARLWIRVPAGFTRTIFDPSIGWGYSNTPSAATGNREIPCPRGRVIGGSSSINGHLYVRGQASDYADWALACGEEWGWAGVLPYFRRAETRIGGDPATRGLDGPLQVTDPRLRHPLCEAFIAAMRSVGSPLNPDYNSGDQEGCGYYQYLMRRGRRWSAADAYLRPALLRPNFALRKHAQVTRIVFEGKRAVGVEYRIGGQARMARAAAEVLVAAGAINSPQLLQLSGIGAPERLTALGLTLVHPSPAVGEGLVDHYAVRVAARVRGIGSLNERSHGARLLAEGLKYLVARRGILCSAVAHAYGFLKLTPGQTRPDTQLLFAPASYERGRVGQADLERSPGLTCGISQPRPRSRGYVRIRSGDALAPPEIQPNYLSANEDRELFLRGLQFVRRLFAAPALARYIQAETWPGPAVSSEEQLSEFVRMTGSTVYHPVGSCRMGSDSAAPIDPQLRVRGVQSLRVIDASVMPSMVSGNTYAATIMVAEKGAQLVLDGR